MVPELFDLLTQNITLVNGRILTITLDTAQDPLKIIGLYAPHNGHELDDRTKFWDSIEAITQQPPPSTDLFLIGDFNAQPTWDYDDDGLVAGVPGHGVDASVGQPKCNGERPAHRW